MNTRTQGDATRLNKAAPRLAVVAINRWMTGLLIGLCGVSLMLGAHTIAWADLSAGSSDAWLMITASRLPRLVAILLTGVGLAISGVILQQIVQNRFVEPGTSGGLDAAKLGILIALTQLPTAGKIGQMLFALVFCFATILVYLAIIRRIQFKNTPLVPVIGLMYGGLLSACAEFYAYHYNIMQSMQGWLLGDFSKIVQGQYEVIYLIVPIVLVTYLYAHRFTVMGMGEATAKSLGLSYTTTAAIGLMLVALTVAVTVISVGAIYFIGLVIPNLVALRYGDNLRHTLPTVALGGALLLLACDMIGRLLVYPFEVPIGLTAGGIGGVIFLALLLRGGQH